MNAPHPLAACTIVSANYISYARVAARSFAETNPGIPFYVCLVDRNEGSFDPAAEPFTLIEVESLGIPNFRSASFRFDIVELNTNVKAAFLRHLLTVRGHQRVLYFDPDIRVIASADFLFQRLETASIILTPHILSPITDTKRPAEADHLWTGVFNLGFVGVNNSPEGLAFLDWWCERCLTLGYNDPRAGIFVDQKWANLVPCFFSDYAVIRHRGCNMAYWNLHERKLTQVDGKWLVNGTEPLVFFHFSGFTHNDLDAISRHQDRATLTLRPDLRPLFEDYRQRLMDAGWEQTRSRTYAFERLTDGRSISNLARRFFAVMEDKFPGADPFDPKSAFGKWADAKGFLASGGRVKEFNSRTADRKDWRLQMVHRTFRQALRVLGPDRYWHLMRYLQYVSILRYQRPILDDE